MTVERRLIVGIEDIKGVCFECLNPNCMARTTFPPDKIGDIPATCGRCHEMWIAFTPESRDTMVASPFRNFTSSIERIRWLNKEGVTRGFRILLEFEEPNESK